jgi:hypothetical protein
MPAAGSGIVPLVKSPAGDWQPMRANSASLHAVQQEGISHGAGAAVGGVGQVLQQPLRPPTRQRPPAESLHLFNNFAALS